MPTARCQRRSPAESGLVLAAAVAFAPLQKEAGEREIDIQWMPPGEHKVRCTLDGKPVEMRVAATEAGALAAEAARREIFESGGSPYLDFNHDDGPASARVLEIYWGGDDPETGGIRAKVRLTEEGFAALAGGSYRSFSPAFFFRDGAVAGAPENMGGFVNRPAFRNIRPVPLAAAAKENPTNPAPETNDQTDMELKTLAIGLLGLAPEATDEQIADALKAALGGKQAAETDLAEAKQQLAAAQKSLSEARAREAQAAVSAAVAQGKLPAADQALHARWAEEITKNPAAAELLEKLPAGQAADKALFDKTVKAKEAAGTDVLATFRGMRAGKEKDAYLRAHAGEILAAERAGN